MRWVLALWELPGPSREFSDEQHDLKSVDCKTEGRVDGKMQSKDRNDSNGAENGVKEWVKMFCNSFFKNIPDSEVDKILEEIQEAVKPTNYRNGSWYGNYKRLRIAAVKL